MLWDIISLSYLLYVVVIGVYLFIEKRSRFLRFTLGLMTGQLFIKYFHRYNWHTTFKRPEDAVNCNMFNRGNYYTERGGMPSGHVSMTTYIWVYLCLSVKRLDIAIAGAVAILLMGLSRYYKHCHTPLQIVMGVVFGTLYALVWIPTW